MKRAAAGKRRDANEPAIISALRAVGASVEQLSGAGIPDLLVGYRGFNWLLEVKVETKKLLYGQCKWHTAWAGNVLVVRSPEHALQCIGATARRTA